MADFEQSFEKKKKKRKHRSTKYEIGKQEEEVVEGPAKISRTDSSERKPTQKIDVNVEEVSRWGNLELILSLQNKNIDLQTKVELAFNYVKSRTTGDSSRVFETVSHSRVIVFMNNWIQTVLISSAKRVKAEECKDQLENAASYLDYRCWAVFKFCLEESLRQNISLSFLRDFLRVIHFVARDALSLLNVESHCSEGAVLSGEEPELNEIFLNCISLLFSSHGGVLNENLDLWVMVIDTVLELLRIVVRDKRDGSRAGIFVLQLSSYLLEAFAKFLRVHPTRKNSFGDFVDRFLEPLMHLLDELRHYTSSKNPYWTKDLLKLVEDVLSQGLFHQTHIDGFLSLQSTGKYRTSDGGKSKDVVMVIKSYHRHLFDKLEKVIASKNVFPLGGIGELIRLFVSCVVKHKGVSSIREPSKNLEGGSAGHIFERSFGGSNLVAEKYQNLGTADTESRKSLFDFFVQIMEYFLLHIDNYLQAELEVGTSWSDILVVFRSANKLLESFKQEGIYIRMEDTSEGACMNFLQFIYEKIMSFSAKIHHPLLSSFSSHKETQEMLISLMKELVAAIHCLLDIEYKVIGDDLESLWGMMLSFSACSHTLMEAPDQLFLTFEILHLGYRLIDLYKELRQVNTLIFGLCKAVRLLVSPVRDRSYSCWSYANSLSMLICSPEFRSSICSAVKSIPEGQANGCIRQLTADISESLEWLKVQRPLAPGNDFSKPRDVECSFQFDLRGEVLGRVLSELYTIILDSMKVTTGNSKPVGVSVKGLMAFIFSSSSTVDSLKSDIKGKFSSIIFGRTPSKEVELETGPLSQWLLLFFFRLYLSCRNLYRQVISLVPPDTSRKMSEAMSDSYAAYSGRDWLEGGGQSAENYFSWIIQPSASLLTITESISDICFPDTFAHCPPLVYVLSAMALQRIADLNRIIKSFEYLLVRNAKLVETKMIDETGVLLYGKRNKKWTRRLLDTKKEAAGLTKFVVGCLLSLVKDQLSICLSKDGFLGNLYVESLHTDNEWDFSVGALHEKSLPSALWLIVCQNIDIWSAHAGKKELKKFLMLLIWFSLPCVSGAISESGTCCVNRVGHQKKNTVHQTSLELLSDTVLYEQRFVRRHIASRFCRILETYLGSLFPNCGEVYPNSLSNWSEIIHALETSTNDISREKHLKKYDSSQAKSSSQLLQRFLGDSCKKEKLAPSSNNYYAYCHGLLNLLTWMPKGYLGSKSFTSLAACILSLERMVVGSLLGWHKPSLEDHHELFRLLFFSRRTLKNLLMVSSEVKVDDRLSSLVCLLSHSSFPLLWLLKTLTAVVEFQHAFSVASQVEDMLFSMMDHTSCMFLTIGKYQFEHAIKSCGKGCEGEPSTDITCEDIDMIEHDLHSEVPINNDAWRSVILISENLRENMENSCNCFNTAYASEKVGVLALFQELKKLSPVISCIQGFLWGLASGLENAGIDSSTKIRLSKIENEPLHKLSIFINACVEFINYFLNLLLLKDDSCHRSLPDAQAPNIPECGHLLGSGKSLYKVNADVNDALDREEALNSESFEKLSASPDMNGESYTNPVVEGEICPRDIDVESLLSKVQLFVQHCSKKPLLQGLLKGENREVAYFLRNLFLASSAILRLQLQISCSSLFHNLIPILIGISEVLLSEFGNKTGVSTPFSYVWLDGVAKFLEEVGTCFPSSNPLLSRNLYVKLIDLQLRAIGSCIVLQGKRATLASKESDLSNKRPSDWVEFCEPILSYKTYCLDELKNKLRTSFRVLIQKSSELHLLAAIQAIERAVVGVQEGCMTNYEITTGSSNGGKVSSTVAAGIDCLDLILEVVSGRKRLNVVKRHIKSLVACLFNVILHLQGPNIFCENDNPGEGCTGPHSGTVVLMCIGVLNRVYGKKHALFQIDPCHVSQSLRIPAALFQNILQLQLSEASGQSNWPSVSNSGNTHALLNISSCILDQRFSVELYAASCRLLCTVVKHHKSETQRSVALLQDSVNILLCCLEIVNVDPIVKKGNNAWDVQEAVKCACCLRRVYEELRQQKDIFGRYCPQFLSSYIWVYCGYSPLKAGIKREIDEALRPGLYSLMDTCSTDDLQHLHTVFGEGPCRSTLGILQNDYKLNFQYEGKV